MVFGCELIKKNVLKKVQNNNAVYAKNQALFCLNVFCCK